MPVDRTVAPVATPEGGVAPESVDRRRFLRVASALSAAASALLVAAPALRAFLSPAFQGRVSVPWTKVAQADEVAIGTPVKVDFAQSVSDAWVETRALRTVWLYSEDGETFTAFSGTCPHLGCTVAFDAARKRFQCPCHRGLFDATTGAVLDGPPPRGLDPLPVRVVEGEVQVLLKQFRPGVPDRIEV